MKITSDQMVHARTVHMRIEWPELKALIVQAAADELAKNPKDFTANVELHQETEGSPEYRVMRWRAMISLVENLNK